MIYLFYNVLIQCFMLLFYCGYNHTGTTAFGLPLISGDGLKYFYKLLQVSGQHEFSVSKLAFCTSMSNSFFILMLIIA